MKLAVLILPLFISSICIAQGTLVINTPPEVDTLLERTLNKSKLNHFFPGFRIQVYQSNNRNSAFEMKKELMALLPDENVNLIFNEPHYKIRVGCYRSKLEAQQLYQELLKIYPQTFIIPDKINLDELK